MWIHVAINFITGYVQDRNYVRTEKLIGKKSMPTIDHLSDCGLCS